jgi:hypothetical protein
MSMSESFFRISGGREMQWLIIAIGIPLSGLSTRRLPPCPTLMIIDAANVA